MGAIVAPSGTAAPSVRPSASTALASIVSVEDVSIKDLGKCLLPSPAVAHLGVAAVVYLGPPKRCLWTTASL
jgi:hypothetical protein